MLQVGLRFECTLLLILAISLFSYTAVGGTSGKGNDNDYGELPYGTLANTSKNCATTSPTTGTTTSMTTTINSTLTITYNTVLTSASTTKAVTDTNYVIYYHGLMALLAVFAMCANSLAVAAVAVTPSLRTVTNYFIVALAVVEAFASVFYFLYSLGILMITEAAIRNFIGTWEMCEWLLIMSVGLLNVSRYMLVAITCIRLISITDPLRYETRVTPHRALTTIAIVCFANIAISAAFFSRSAPSLLIILYARLFTIARKQFLAVTRQQLELQGVNSSIYGTGIERTLIWKNELKLFKVASAMIGYCIVTWLLLTVFLIATTSCGCQPNKYIGATTRLLTQSNNAVDVLIYACRLAEFRTAMRRLLVRLLPGCCMPYLQSNSSCCCNLSTSTVYPISTPPKHRHPPVLVYVQGTAAYDKSNEDNSNWRHQ